METGRAHPGDSSPWPPSRRDRQRIARRFIAGRLRPVSQTSPGGTTEPTRTHSAALTASSPSIPHYFVIDKAALKGPRTVATDAARADRPQRNPCSPSRAPHPVRTRWVGGLTTRGQWRCRSPPIHRGRRPRAPIPTTHVANPARIQTNRAANGVRGVTMEAKGGESQGERLFHAKACSNGLVVLAISGDRTCSRASAALVASFPRTG